MTTESVLEKLKRYKTLQDARAWDYPDDEIVEQWQDLHNWYCEAFKDRLIAALELVEAKAKEEPWIDYRQGRHPGEIWKLGVDNGEINFAREVLAVVNGETKGE